VSKWVDTKSVVMNSSVVGKLTVSTCSFVMGGLANLSN